MHYKDDLKEDIKTDNVNHLVSIEIPLSNGVITSVNKLILKGI